MQTTLRLDDALYREAKAAAALEGITLTRFLEEGIRLRIESGAVGTAGAPARLRTRREASEEGKPEEAPAREEKKAKTGGPEAARYFEPNERLLEQD